MAEKSSFPQIPSTVWWGVRAQLQRTPNATIDERLLSVTLGVQEAAARQYVAELKRVGILTDDNKATPTAHKWRLDDQYSEAVDEIMSAAYPEGLRHVAPPGEADRQKVVSWFLREGLGQGAANNKAATYLLISSKEPSDGRGAAGAKTVQNDGPKAAPKPRRTPARTANAEVTSSPGKPPHAPRPQQRTDSIPLNVNVQIHISADAGPEQIESIFSAMRRYLYDNPAA